jgi:hypothetical protein
VRSAADCHPDRPSVSRGRCGACYERERRAPGFVATGKGVLVAECHPDRTHYAKGLCGSCYSAARVRPHDPAGQRVRILRQRYGLTMDEYVSLAEAQGGRCAICRQPETHRDRSGSVQPLGVDHDHRTGKVRGLLCHSCNTALGYFRDDPALLTAAAEYVMRKRARGEIA